MEPESFSPKRLWQVLLAGVAAISIASAGLFLAFPGNLRVNLAGLLLVQPVSLAAIIFFAMRSRFALGFPYPIAKLVQANAIAIAASAFLPAKAGELLKPSVLRRLGEAPLSSGFSMVLIERGFDSLALLFLAGVGVYSGLGLFETPPDISIVVLIAIALLMGFAVSLMSRRLRQFLLSVLVEVRRTLSDSARLAGMGFLTVTLWALSFGMMVIFGLSAGHDGLGVRELTTIFVASTLGIAVGITPGGWGIVEGLTVGLLLLYGLSFGEALTFAIMFRLSVILLPTVIAVSSIKSLLATQAGENVA